MTGYVRAQLEALGRVVRLGTAALTGAFRLPLEWDLWMDQLLKLGLRSMTVTNITLLFTGMVLSVQTAYALALYGGESFIGDIIGLSIVLELGPVLTALMVAGRVGAGITAELGTMKVTEQVDALRALAADPVRKLVVPRVWALILMLPVLTILADTVALFGGMVMAGVKAGQSRTYFVTQVLGALTVKDVFSGVGKTVFFGLCIGVIACHNGLSATGGADGVGKATTNTVVMSSIAVIIANFFLTNLFFLLPL